MNNLPEIDGISVVFLGAFNPSIFHPEWFARQGLIAEAELHESQVEVISRELTLMNIGSIRLAAQTERFQLETTSLDLLPVVRDLALGTFQYLAHTPVTSMGMNRHLHFKMTSTEEWHTVGHALAPKGPWDGLITEPGLLGVSMQGKRPGASSEYLRVQVEPSKKVTPGVYVGTNEHYSFAEQGSDALERLLKCLGAEWEEAQNYARSTAEELLERCLGGKR